MTDMYCAQCGEIMAQDAHGTRSRCCEGFGYWTNLAPTPNDAAAFYQLTGQRIAIDTTGEFYLYRNPKWPKGKRPIEPRR